MLKMWY